MKYSPSPELVKRPLDRPAPCAIYFWHNRIPEPLPERVARSLQIGNTMAPNPIFGGGVFLSSPFSKEETVSPSNTDKSALSSKSRERRLRDTPDVVGAARRMIVAAGERVAYEDPNSLRHLVVIKVTLTAAFQTAITGLRYNFSDAQIAKALGVSKQAIQQGGQEQIRRKNMTERNNIHLPELPDDELRELDKALDIGTHRTYDRCPTEDERAAWLRYAALVLSGRGDDLERELVSMLADDDRMVIAYAEERSPPGHEHFWLNVVVCPDSLEDEDDAP